MKSLQFGILAAGTFAFMALSGEDARAACTPAAANGVTANCTGDTVNQGPGAGNGYGDGNQIDVNLTVAPGATLTGTTYGVNLGGGTVFNFGSISGGEYGIYGSYSNLTNYGTISNAGASAAVWAPNGSNVTNYGTIIGAPYSFFFFANSTLNNSGYIKGIIIFEKQAVLTNSGTIVSGISFNQNGGPYNDTVNILPGARFGGTIDFGGGSDKVNFGSGSWVLNTTNFDAALATINTGGNPYVVTANKIVVADVSGFGAQNRATMDIVGWISSVLPDSPVFEDTPSVAFAALASAAHVDDSAAGTPSNAMGYAPVAPVFKSAAMTDRYGNSVWAKGFGGRRKQTTDSAFIGSVTTGFGGAIGIDRRISNSLRLGGFLGGSSNKSDLDLNAGGTDTDVMFGGVYSRVTFGTAFFDAALIGGRLGNSSTRNIGGGMAMETARASYDGWFFNPTAAIGQRFGLDHGFSLTPAFKLRYVSAHFGGYSETGSTSNLTVGARNVQALEERAELTLAKVGTLAGHRVTYRLTGGGLSQQRLGGGTVDLTLLGQGLTASTPDGKNTTGGYASAGFDWQLGATTLFAAGEWTGASDSSTSYSGKGGVRVTW